MEGAEWHYGQEPGESSGAHAQVGNPNLKSQSTHMFVKQCQKPPIWIDGLYRFIPPIDGGIVEGPMALLTLMILMEMHDCSSAGLPFI